MKYLKDFRGYSHFVIFLIKDKLFCWFSTAYLRLMMTSKGVCYGKGVKSYGIVKVHRVPLSKIKIGSKVTFRSDQSSNLIGVNHKCILSTHDKDAKIVIGDRCGLSGVTIGAKQSIVVGDNVLFGANSVITDFDWHEDRYASGSKPIVIRDNAWIGLNTIVLKGVEIGKNSIIGANSVVTTDIPDNVIAAGNPCKTIKKLD